MTNQPTATSASERTSRESGDTEPVRPAKYMVATVPAAGHTHPVVRVVRELVARGHEVSWLTGSGFRDLVESTGARFEPLQETHDPVHGASFVQRFPGRSGLSGLAGIEFDLKHVFLDEIPGQVADLQRALSTFDADLVVADAGFLGAAIQHELGGPRWVTIGVTPLTIASRDVAPFGGGLPPIRTRRDRIRAAVLSLGQRTLMRDVERHHALVRARLGLPPFRRSFFASFNSPYLVIQTGTAGTDYPRSDLPPHVHYVGALTTGGHPSRVQTDWPALAAGRPIVVVTQGTVATESASLLEPAIRALAAEEVFVVAIGGTDAVDLPDNTRRVSYLPYEEILPFAAAMVTNGGYGGVQAAFAHGVPLAVAGTTEDKPEVAARVAWTGAGINMRTSQPSDEALRRAVRQLIDDEQIRTRVRQIAEDYAQHDAPCRSADLIDVLVAAGPLGPAGTTALASRRLESSPS